MQSRVKARAGRMPVLFRCWFVVLCFSLTLVADGPLTGRWLFQGLSDSGKKVPLFIIEFPASGKASVLSTSAPFEIRLSDFTAEADSLTLQLLADGRPLTLKGTLTNGVISGKTAGQTLSGFSFLAERTDQTELKTVKQPAAEELEAFQTAANNPDPKQKIATLRSLIAKYPETTLKTSALLEIIGAGLEGSQSDEELAGVIDEALQSTSDEATVRNDIAFGLAEKNRLLRKAEELVRKAVEMARPGTTVKANFQDTLGWVLYRQGRLNEANAALRSALDTLPRGRGIALHLAEVLERQDKNLEAVEVYLQAHVGGGDRQAQNTARNLYYKHKGTPEGFHNLLDQAYAKVPPLFDPGRFEGTHSGPALVAELFTGAQCGPCQSADYAFDGLLARFPETVVNILQYHVHVPGPDPMTSPDSLARARLYKIRSTPTAIFSGTEVRPGGGPTARAEMAFRQYLDVIEAQLQTQGQAHVDLQVHSERDTILASGKVSGATNAGTDDLRLYIALVERTVHYTGSNGVHLNHNVVRKFLNGGEGTRLTSPDFEFKQAGSLSAIETEIKQYVDRVAQEWGMPFNEAPTSINRSDLAIVAFVQNAQTHQILGSAMASVK